MAVLLFFGKLQDSVGLSTENFNVPETVTNTSQLRAHLDRQYKLTGTLTSETVRVAVNNEIVADPAPIHNEDEIAFLPPVGGG